MAALFASRHVLFPALLEEMVNRHFQSQGVHVTLDAVSGNFFSSLDLEGVKIVARQPHPLQIATIAKVALGFDLLALARGRDAFLATGKIHLHQPNCTLAPAIPLPPTAATTGPGRELFPPPAFLPQLEVSDGRLLLANEKGETEFTALALRTKADPSAPTSLPLAFQSGEIIHRRPDHPKLATSIRGELTLAPTTVRVDALHLGDRFLSGRGEFKFGAKEGDLDGRLEITLAEVGTATLALVLGQGQLTMTVAGADLPLAPLLAAAGQPDLALDGRLSGSIAAACPITNLEQCRGKADLKLTAGHWRQLGIDNLELRAASDSSRLTLEYARLESGNDLLLLNETVMPLAALAAGDYPELLRQGRGNFEIELHHLPQLLAAAGLRLNEPPAAIPDHALHLAGSFEDNVLTIPTGGLQLPSGQISLADGRFSLPQPQAPLTDLLLQGRLAVDLPDLTLLANVLALPPLQGKLRASAELSGPWRQLKGQAQIAADHLVFRGKTIGNLIASGHADRQRLQIDSVILSNGGDQLKGHGTVVLANWRDSQGQLNLFVEELKAYSWLLPDAAGLSGGLDLVLNWQGGSWRAPTGTAKIHGHDLVYHGLPLGEFHVAMAAADATLSWADLRLTRGEDRLESRGQFRLATMEFAELLASGKVADLNNYTQSFLPPEWRVKGPLLFRVKGGGKLADPHLTMEMSGENLLLRATKLDQVALHGTLDHHRLTIEALKLSAHGSELDGAGSLTKNQAGWQAELSRLAFRHQEFNLQLAAPAHVELDRQQRWRMEPLLFTDQQSTLQISGQGTSERWQLKGMAHNLASHGWLELVAGDTVSFTGLAADFEFSSTPEGPEFSCQGNLAELNLDQQRRLGGNFDFTFNPQGFSFRKFSWQTRDGLQLYLNGHLPFNPWATNPFLPSPLALDATINLPTLEALGAFLPRPYIHSGSFQATTNLSGSWRHPLGHLTFSGKELLLADTFKQFHPLPLTLAGSLDFEQDTVHLREFQAFSDLLELRLAGRCTSLPAVNDILRGKVAELGGELNLIGKLAIPEVAKLGFAIPGMRRFGGRLDSELTITGPLADPTVVNTIALADGFLRPDWDLPAFNELKLNATLAWPILTLDALQGEFGGAPFTIGGAIDCQQPRNPNFDLHLLSDNLLVYRQPGLKLRGNAEVTLTGPLSGLKLAGGVAITNSSFTEDVKYMALLLGGHRPKNGSGVELFSIMDKPFRDMAFDIKFTAKNPIRVKNNMASGGFRPNVKLLGTGELPLLVGDFFLDKTRVNLPTGQFTFESGLMRFPADEPDRQLLDLTGNAQLLGYDVAVQIHGPYNDSVVTLTSNPSLPQEDLLLLVLTGKAPAQNLGSAVAQKSGMKVALYLGRNMLNRWFDGGGDSDQSILDRFELEIGRGLTQLGEDTIESRFRLANGVFRADDVLFLTAEKDIYDNVNAGVKIVFRFP